MSIIVFDIETNGLPDKLGFDKYYHPSLTHKYDKCRIIEIAYIIFDVSGNELKRFTSLIKPDGFVIDNHHIHNITTDNAIKNGKSIICVLDEFKNDISKCNRIVAHNIMFDKTILLSECYRYNRLDIIKDLDYITPYCTMNMGRNKMKVLKYPKLIELYKYIFNEDIIQNHRALDDVILCSKCYLYLI